MATLIVVKPYPKNPYSSPKTINSVKFFAVPHSAKVAIVDITEQAIASALTGIFLSDRYPQLNWPRTCAKDMMARMRAPEVEERPIEVA